MIGCQYVMSRTKEFNHKTKKWDDVPIRCGKLPGENDDHCPKHRLFVEDEKLEGERKRLARIDRKNNKKQRQEELATSPLAAVNEEFKEKKKADWLQGYSI